MEMENAPKKRGRPSTGNAKSAAQRKKDQRWKEMAEILRFEELDNISDSGLLDLMANSGLRGSIGERVWREWGRRMGFKSDSRGN